MNDILDAAESLEREAVKFESEKARILDQAEVEKNKLREEIAWMKAENEKLLYRLRQMDLQRQRDASPLAAPVTPRTAALTATAQFCALAPCFLSSSPHFFMFFFVDFNRRRRLVCHNHHLQQVL